MPTPFIEPVQTATPVYRLLNNVGTLAMTTDNSGNVTGTNVLTPYGETLSSNTSDPYPYAGLMLDTDGTDIAKARKYAVAPARWLRPDPYNGSYDLTNPQSMNRYVYAMDNPLSYTDPTGLDWSVTENGTTYIHGDPTPGTIYLDNFGTNDFYLGLIGLRGINTGNYGLGIAGTGTSGSNAANNCTGSGVSIGVGGNADLGFFEGASAQGSAMAGTTTTATGGTLSGGAMAGGPFGTVGAPTQTTNSIVVGAYVGVGVQAGVTNAGSMRALSGPFKTVSVNAGLGTLNFGLSLSWSGNIFQFTFTPPALSLGLGFGASYTTTTTKQKTINSVHNGPC